MNRMNAVFQKQGNLGESKDVLFLHVSTSVRVPKESIGSSLLQFQRVCDRVARAAGYDLGDIVLEETKIIIRFCQSEFEHLDSLLEVNQIWEGMNEACKQILLPIGCKEWWIELEIFEEELDPDLDLRSLTDTYPGVPEDKVSEFLVNW
jgi:hypothetical protein